MSSDYLLDTSVLSSIAPGRPPLPAAVAAWLEGNDATIYLSSVTVAEIQQGVEKLRRAKGFARADRLEGWLVEIIAQFGERLLVFDADCAREAGRMADAAIADGTHPGFPDVAIAATARRHGLTILTSNLRHFGPLKVPCLDPFAAG
ncbi:MAG: type II toxin-antitoxin system VapC family toxin [Devosia sp.]|nr:type II toxin-antitoxin system VapC family toxin [Devosia sp.]